MPNGFANSTTPIAAAYARTVGVEFGLNDGLLGFLDGQPRGTASSHRDTAAPPPPNPKPEKKWEKYKGTFGRAKGKAAVFLKSAMNRSGPKKPDNSVEQAWADTNMYLKSFSKKSAFAPYKATMKTIMDHTMSKYAAEGPGQVRSQRSLRAWYDGGSDRARPPPPTAEEVTNMPAVPSGHRSRQLQTP
jgi:hypothetical protein